MMSCRVQFEVFEASDMTTNRIVFSRDELEERRLADYEQGYAAGWEDAIAAQDQEISRLRSDLGRSLQEMSFTYHEAHSHVLRTLEPLLQDMVSKVLPAIAREVLAPMVIEHLRPVAKELASQPVVLVAHPSNREMLEQIVIADATFPIEFREEPSLGDGQAHLLLGEEETRVDLDGVVNAIASAVSGFFQIEKQEERRHG